jgi:hypothetical protein
MPWRDSASRTLAPVTSVAGGDDTTRAMAEFRYFYAGSL